MVFLNPLTGPMGRKVKKMSRFQVVTWHGERRTAFYVVDTWAQPEDDPEIVESFERRIDADEEADRLNLYDSQQEYADAVAGLGG